MNEHNQPDDDERWRRSQDPRAEELHWIAKNKAYLWEHHAGQWIAVQGSQLVAFGDDLNQVMDEARASGVDDPLVSRVRAKEYQNAKMIR